MSAAMYITISLTGFVLAAAAARAHYVTRSSARRDVYWCVLALAVSAGVAPMMVSAFSWNGASQFYMHITLVLAAVYAVAVYSKHQRTARMGGARAAVYEQQWGAIAMALCMVAFTTLLAYIVVYPAY